ncbi:MAG: hypothetical protein JJLCMIEE_02964 [Acidimicrobiales bacterium]|nr:hypothetical protein [Acidimicrobiales bacterium]
MGADQLIHDPDIKAMEAVIDELDPGRRLIVTLGIGKLITLAMDNDDQPPEEDAA